MEKKAQKRRIEGKKRRGGEEKEGQCSLSGGDAEIGLPCEGPACSFSEFIFLTQQIHTDHPCCAAMCIHAGPMLSAGDAVLNRVDKVPPLWW